MTAIVVVIALAAAGIWLWFAEDHELIAEMRRGRQAEGPNAAARRRGGRPWARS